MATLIDTNLLVYCFDARFPDKQLLAAAFVESRLADGSAYLAHQALIEFVAAMTRSRGGEQPLMTMEEAIRETEELMIQFPVLYPSAAVVRGALRGMAAYLLSWFDAHMWAYADAFGRDELASEDFQDGRSYGGVHCLNPLLRSAPG